jgi:hypothetical protein
VRTVFTRWEDAGIDAAWYVYTLGQIPPDEAIFALIDQHQVAPICKATELAQNGLGMSVVPWPPRP